MLPKFLRSLSGLLLSIALTGCPPFTPEVVDPPSKPEAVQSSVPTTPPTQATPTQATPVPTPELPSAKPSAPEVSEESQALEWLIQTPARWPKNVKLTQAKEFPVILNGITRGKTTLPNGAQGKLISFAKDVVEAEFAAAPRRLSINDTDLIFQAVDAYRNASTPENLAAYQETNIPTVHSSTKTTSFQELDSGTLVNLDREVSATELSNYLKVNRDKFRELAGKTVVVSGVVDEIRVSPTSVGDVPQAEITLRTNQGSPKIRMKINSSEFIENPFRSRAEIRVHNKTLESRVKDYRYSYNDPYYYWYYDGYWRRRVIRSSTWMPIIAVGQSIKGQGTLESFHIHVDLSNATIEKN